jgi:DNA-directed RNA polymerase specialized sigma24 family protein
MDEVPLAALEHEWRTLVRGRLAVDYRRWAATEPVLAAFAGPERLLEFLWNEEASPEAQDRALAALLRLARREPLAARFILQALLPGLKKRAGELLRPRPGRESERSALERDELWQVLFVSVLERIQTFPLERRPRKIASNLLWDTVHVTYAELKKARGSLEEIPRDEPLEAAEPAEVPADIEAVLQKAVRAGAVSAAEAELIAETEIEGVTLEEVAKRLGITYNAVKVRRQKAERRLLTYLNGEAEIPYIQMDPKGRSKRPTSGAYAAEAKKPTVEPDRTPAAEKGRPVPVPPRLQLSIKQGGTALEGT